MTTDFLPELDPSTLLERISTGDLPREFILLAARGFLRNDDAEIAAAASSSLGETSPTAVAAFAANPHSAIAELESLAAGSDDPLIVEALLRNRSLPDAVVATLAERLAPTLQDVVVTNQERILRHPEILDALLRNPQLTGDARRRALEIRTEFFEKARKVAERVVVPAAIQDFELEPISADDEAIMRDLIVKAVEAERALEAKAMPEPPGDLDEKKQTIWVQILMMTVSDKVQLAFKGDRTARGILIRDRNRMVSTAVLRSPRVTVSEVEGIAGMRNVEEEVLRIIGNSREWTSKYPVVWNLVRNPKAPLGVVLTLLNRLTLRDLKTLSIDRGVPEVVRVSSRRIFLARSTK
jgi:hypothetical protein